VVPSVRDESHADWSAGTDVDLFIGQCAAGVPCGDAAAEVLAAAGLTVSIDSAEPDVRAVATKLAEGEFDAAIVYRSDVVGNDRIDGVDIDPAFDVMPVYPIALLADASHPSDAERFIEFVASNAGDEVLTEHGFTPIEDGR